MSLNNVNDMHPILVHNVAGIIQGSPVLRGSGAPNTGSITGSLTNAEVGSLFSQTDAAGLWLRTGSGDLAWSQITVP